MKGRQEGSLGGVQLGTEQEHSGGPWHGVGASAGAREQVRGTE